MGKADSIRCINDVALFEKLKQQQDVKRVIEMINRHEAEGPSGTRRHLLSTSVRLSQAMAPDIHAMADDCVEALGVELPVELYVYASPQFNAACFKPDEERLYIMFSSSLIEGFDADEFKFVMGHELGHHVYRHHDIPIGYLLRNPQQRPDPKLALELFAWSRYAEISADRAGAHCAQNMDSVARALFKLSSGLSSKLIQFSLDDFIAQVDDMQVADSEPGQGAPQSDWFSTHPFSPLRVKALKLFEGSQLYRCGEGMAQKELEVAVQKVMSLMEPSYLEAKTDTAEAMRRLLFAGALLVANADGEISKEEVAVFEKFFGKYSYKEGINIEKNREVLARRMQEVNEKASVTQRMQVLHDVCQVAKSDGDVSEKERAQLDEIARGLEVSTAFICQSLEDKSELD